MCICCAYVGMRLLGGFCHLWCEAKRLREDRLARERTQVARNTARPACPPSQYGGRIDIVNGRLRLLDAAGNLVNPGL